MVSRTRRLPLWDRAADGAAAPTQEGVSCSIPARVLGPCRAPAGRDRDPSRRFEAETGEARPQRAGVGHRTRHASPHRSLPPRPRQALPAHGQASLEIPDPIRLDGAFTDAKKAGAGALLMLGSSLHRHGCRPPRRAARCRGAADGEDVAHRRSVSLAGDWAPCLDALAPTAARDWVRRRLNRAIEWRDAEGKTERFDDLAPNLCASR